MTCLELASVSKRYGRRGPLILDQIGLTLEAGSLTQVRGGNGCGKTTLLRVACGFSRPTDGRVVHRPVSFGFVPDRVAPPARMTGRDWLAHLGRLRGHFTESAAVALSERLGLAPGLDAPLGTLSRGNLQKVVLTQALAPAVELVVLDEPFVALDVAARAELVAILGERVADGGAVLVTTHTADLGNQGRVLALAGGRLSETAGFSNRLVAIELDGSHSSPAVVSRSAGAGYVRHLVAADQVNAFLMAALADGRQVRRVNPLDRDPR